MGMKKKEEKKRVGV